MVEKWIQKAIKRPGALRKKLGVKKGAKISKKRLEKAKKSDNPRTRKQANLAVTLRKLRNKASKKAMKGY